MFLLPKPIFFFKKFSHNDHFLLVKKLTIKKVLEVDLLEQIKNNGIFNSDVELSEEKIKFSINPNEIKSILVIEKIPLEE